MRNRFLHALTALLISALSLSTSLFASGYNIGSIELTNIDESYKKVIFELLKFELEKHQVYSQASDAMALDVHAIGSAKSAKILVRVNQSGKLVRTLAMSIDTPDDLEITIERLARSVIEGKSAKDSQDIFTVTDKERKALKVQTTHNYFGAFVGVHLVKMGKSPSPRNQFGVYYLVDLREIMGEISFTATNSADLNLRTQGLSIFYPLEQSTSSIYLGGGFHMVNYEEKANGTESWADGEGSALRFCAGYLFGRTMDALFRIESGLQLMNLEGRSNQLGVDLRLGIGF